MRTTLFSLIILGLTAILLAFSISCFYGYFYPMRYSSEIREVAKEYELEPALIASMINVESSYKPERKSVKGAVGLMQLMPVTAEWLCKNLNIEYKEEALVEPKYNINLGGYYLSRLLKSFGNSQTALCAYNAGPTNVREWLKNTEYSEDGKTLKKIPFEETRNYIQRVEKNLKYYRDRYK